MDGPTMEEDFFSESNDQSDEIIHEELERELQNNAVEFGKVKLKDLFPVNFTEQRNKFHQQKGEYNPHFLYKTVVYPQPIVLSTEHEELAIKILKNSPPYENTQKLLSEEEVSERIEQYLDNLGLKDYVQIKMEFQCLSRTSVAFYKNRAVLKIRTPLSYTQTNLQGVLNHEVGTHILRTLNHKQNCVRKPSEKGKIIEQGLAALNQLLPQQKPFLFKSALRYIAAIEASKCSFSELFKKLNKFVPDRDECWRECVRVKRGLASTEQKGGFYKDQTYLIGAIEILKNMNDIDFEKLYYGKLSAEETKNLSTGVLPPFLGSPQKLRNYKKKLQKIALCNFIRVGPE